MWAGIAVQFGFPNLGRWSNSLAWTLAAKAIGRVFVPRVNLLRRREGLAPVKDFITEVASSPLLNIIAASPALCNPMPDWPSHNRMCGFLDVPGQNDGDALPEDLERFFRAGPAPVFMTFGSMLLGDLEFERILGVLVDATHRAGCRAIVQASWEEIGGIPETPDVYRLVRAPHARLFPRCAAVVHHGGSGTSHSATLAGCPSIPVTYAYDQTYWARQLHAAGVASSALRRQTLRADDLARKIRETLEMPGIKGRAEELGNRIRDENGVERAVKLIEQAFVASQ